MQELLTGGGGVYHIPLHCIRFMSCQHQRYCFWYAHTITY